MQRQPALVCTRQNQQVVGEPGHALGLLGHGFQSRAKLSLLAIAHQREVDLGAQRRQRGPKLVACVADHSPLPRHRRLEAIEHRVQRPAERADLVRRVGHRQSLRQLAFRNELGPRTHPVDRTQRSARQLISPHAREQQGERPGDQQQRPQPCELVVAKRERASHSHHLLTVGSASAHGEHTHSAQRRRGAVELQ
jgi:hypothetical protein